MLLKRRPMLGGWCARFCKASRGPDRRVVLVLDHALAMRACWTKCGTCSDEGGGAGGERPRMAGWISWCAGVHEVGGKGGVAGGGTPPRVDRDSGRAHHAY